MNWRSQAFLRLAKGQPCYLRLVRCSGTDTVVPAHSNMLRHGRGFGFKSHDLYSVPACHNCHAELDSGVKLSKEDKQDAFLRAWEQWMLHLVRNGHLVVQ